MELFDNVSIDGGTDTNAAMTTREFCKMGANEICEMLGDTLYRAKIGDFIMHVNSDICYEITGVEKGVVIFEKLTNINKSKKHRYNRQLYFAKFVSGTSSSIMRISPAS